MGVCKVISERSVLYVFTFSRRTFDHPFGSSDRRSILRGIRSCGSYRRCRRLTFRTSDCQFSSPRSILAARSSKYIQRSIFSSSCCSAASFPVLIHSTLQNHLHILKNPLLAQRSSPLMPPFPLRWIHNPSVPGR